MPGPVASSSAPAVDPAVDWAGRSTWVQSMPTAAAAPLDTPAGASFDVLDSPIPTAGADEDATGPGIGGPTPR